MAAPASRHIDVLLMGESVQLLPAAAIWKVCDSMPTFTICSWIGEAPVSIAMPALLPGMMLYW